MAKFDTSKDGVWRTIRGRKVFIAKGQSVKEAMKDSGIKNGEAKEPVKAEEKPKLKKPDKKAEMKEAIKKDKKQSEAKKGSDTLNSEAPSKNKKRMEGSEFKKAMARDNRDKPEVQEELKKRGIYLSKDEMPSHVVGKKVRLTLGEYSDSNPFIWYNVVHADADKIIEGKDGTIRIFNDGMETVLPHYEVGDMPQNDRGDYASRKYDFRVRKDGTYYYPTMPSRKKNKSADSRKTAEIRNGLEKSTDSESKLKTPEDYLKAYMDMPRKNAETAKTYRNWRDVMWANSLREDLAGNAEKSEELSHKVYDFEDIARSLEGRETTAHMARRLIAEAEGHSDEVLKDVQDSLKGVEGSVDRGIPFMTKGFKSMRRKLNEKSAEKKLLPEQYAPRVTDALRFTDMVDDEHYVESFNKMKKALEKMGYEMTEATNTIHKEGEDYRGLNTLIESPRGYTFELQFHTPQSFDIKEENHKDYEVSRRMSTSEAKKQMLQDRMTDRSRAVKTPKGAETIKDIERHRRTGPTYAEIQKVMKERGLTREGAVAYLKRQQKKK